MVDQKHLRSVVLPVYNEAACITGVLDELLATLGPEGRHEIILVDDGSTDATPNLLIAYQALHPTTIRLLRLSAHSGQSAAFWAGIQAALGEVIVLMDADGQNDPADIARCVAALKEADICCGYRRARRDTGSKRVASRLANRLRRAVLHDAIIDTGCSLKAFKAPLLKPLQYWDGMHRFLPVLAALQDARIVQIPVNHRCRVGGRSKYTNFGRLRRTLWDLLGVCWLQHRTHRFKVLPLSADEAGT